MDILKYFSNNTQPVDAKEAESKIRNEFSSLLGANEHIELAFKCRGDGRYKNFFTSHRILMKVGKGIGQKRKHFLSIPYKSIKAFSVQTAGGSFLDKDTEVKVWYDGGSGYSPFTIDFVKDAVNLFEVQQYLNNKVFSPTQTTASSPPLSTTNPITQAATIGNVLNWIGSNAIQIDPKSIQGRFGFGGESPILMTGEEVEIAYQTWRDLIILTPTRFLLVDVKGFSGKKIEFFSLHWKCVKAFSVETAGRFDWDGTFFLHTNIPELRHIRQDLRDGKADMFQIQMSFANKLFGGKSTNARIKDVDQKKGHVDPGAPFFGGSNNRPLDAAEVERVYRSNPSLLQNDEYVEMAFRGRRDLVIFTTKRIIDIDIKGLSGKKVKYTSIPYSSVLAFAVRTAGKHDRDSEVIIYTEIRYEVGQGEDQDPGMARLEWDFNKNVVDVLALKRYLNARLLATERGIKVPTGLLAAAPKEHGMGKIMSTFGDDQRTIDAQELETHLRTTIDVLLDDENVVMAFKAGRDITCFTNKRIFIVDKQGWSGKKIEFSSVPYSSIRAFSAESAGSWDRDSTVKIYTKNTWNMANLYLDFRKGKADIIAIQKFLSAIVIGSEHDAANYLKSANFNTVKINHSQVMNGFTDYLIDFSVEEDPQVADAQFHSNPPILLDDERVEKVYREGRDLWVYTTLRILRVDVKGLTGQKVNYISIPFGTGNSVTAFGVETAGHLDFDAECFMFTNIPSIGPLMQKLLVKRGNVYDMHEYLGNRLLFDEKLHQQPSAPTAANKDAYASTSDAYVSAGDYDPYAKYG